MTFRMFGCSPFYLNRELTVSSFVVTIITVLLSDSCYALGQKTNLDRTIALKTQDSILSFEWVEEGFRKFGSEKILKIIIRAGKYINKPLRFVRYAHLMLSTANLSKN